VKLVACLGRVTHRDGGFDDHHRRGVDTHHVLDHRFDGASVEVVGFGIVIGRRGDDDVVGTGVGIYLIHRGAKIQRLVLQVVIDLDVLDRRLLAVQHFHLLGDDVERDDFVMLGQQNGVGESDVAGAGDCDLHR
jgi:hypothetical protein